MSLVDYFAPGLVGAPVEVRSVLAGAALAAGLAVLAVGLAGVRVVLGAATGLQHDAMSHQPCQEWSDFKYSKRPVSMHYIAQSLLYVC